MGRGESIRWRRRIATALLLILPACLGSDDPPRAFPTPEPEPRYVRAVPVGGEARMDPTGALPVSGRVLTARGTPAPGVEVRVERDEYGLFPRLCLIGCTLQPCDIGLDTVTGADGRFLVGMCKRAGRQLSLLVSPALHGAAVNLPVYWKGDRTLLPLLRLWSPRVRFEPATGWVTWSRLPTRGYGALDRYEVDFVHDPDDDDLGERVWFAFIAEEPEVVDERALEDTSGEIFVRAYTKMRLRTPCRPSCSRVFRPSFTAKGVPFEGPGAPPSRGTPCFVGNPRGPRIEACYLTDGDLSRLGYENDCSEQLGCGREPKWVGLDLGARRRVELVVARGCSLCEVFVSSDGRRWTYVLPSGGDESLDNVSLHALRYPRRIRYIRADYPEDMIELSYW